MVDGTGNVALALDHGTPFDEMKTAVEIPTVYLPLVTRNFDPKALSQKIYLPLVLRQ